MRQPTEMLSAIRSQCITGITSRQLQIIGACSLGYSADEIAYALNLSRPTIFRHIQLLGERIFCTEGLIPSRQLLVAWAHIHRGCCSAPAWRLIESDQLFDSEDGFRLERERQQTPASMARSG